MDIKEIDWVKLASAAWKIRNNAFVYGKTKVGSAALGINGEVFAGCNVEHKFRSHDVHSEVNAITNMVSHGETILVAIIIVAEREQFTPCGSCMDWIFQFGGPKCLIGFQNNVNSEIKIYTAEELMPYYPY